MMSEIIYCVLPMIFFFKSQFKTFFCQFQSTAELPEGLMLSLDVFTVKYIIIAPVFLNSLTLCISLG